ncbi:hypothetical protein EZV62_002004 [Acer yangbiense]|uniref:apyrase n=1 Tax=Acer yangbiense TaxID=1000413 RepID=A0A5C7IW36_9ROSI|nr:hypothetical protein EZV62_002004 [Acer yangbiense]
MDLPNLQSRVTSHYIPPHRTQLHPRMHAFSSNPNSKPTTNNNKNKNKLVILIAFLFTVPSLYYLFATAQKVHQSSKFAEPTVRFHGIVIDSGLAAATARVHVFNFLGEGQLPFVDSIKVSHGGLDDDDSIRELIDFAKNKVPKKEWANTKVQLIINGGPVKDKVLEECRRVLRASGFAFKDAWARVIQGQEKGVFAWIAANYALGSLGGEPRETTGVVELDADSLQVHSFLGSFAKIVWLVSADETLRTCKRLKITLMSNKFKSRSSLVYDGKKIFGVYGWFKLEGCVVLDIGSKVTFAMKESPVAQSFQSIRFAGVTYDLYTQSLPQFGQDPTHSVDDLIMELPLFINDAAWELLHVHQNSLELKAFSSSSRRLVDPCIPKGYKLTADSSNRKLMTFHPAGNFSACRSEALALLEKRQDKCLHPPCQIISSFPELRGRPVSPENFLYTSEFLGLLPSASLFELEALGQHYCENDWDKLKNQHRSIDDLDLLRYCFFSAYTVALMHDTLGIPMHDKRIGFSNHAGSIPLDWTLGAFIFQSMLEPLELEVENMDQIVGNESVTYFLLFAFLLIALLAAFFVVQWRKPQLKTIYDLEKGHYIVTRLPR